jgi:hypothetical protein
MSAKYAKLGVLGLLLCAMVLVIPVAGFAQAPTVLTVPYAYGSGGAVVPHPTYITGYAAGPPITCATTKQITLKGTLIDNGTGPYTYSWDYGDGSGATAPTTVTNNYDIEASHAYCGSDGQIFTASLTVTNASLQTASQPYYIQSFDLNTAANGGTDVKASVAIDEGLWNLHKRLIRSNGGCQGFDCAYWNTYGYYVSETSIDTQAFFSAGHTENGSASDPYTDDVQRTMRFLFQYLDADSFGAPWDTNGNGFGLHSNEPGYYGDQFDGYIHGMFLSNLIASNNPNGVTVTGTSGTVLGRKYKDVAQDMVDDAAYCQYPDPNYGGWRYQCQQFPDNSPSQWVAIGLLSAQRQWGLTIPGPSGGYAGVIAMNQGWVAYSQDSPATGDCDGAGYGYFGYTNNCWVWGPYAVTGSGMVQMVLDGYLANSAQFTLSTDWQYVNWDDPSGYPGGPARYNYYYGLLSFTKAMELNYANAAAQAANQPGIPLLQCSATSAEACSAGSFNWYYDPNEGIAAALISAQQPDGGWVSGLDGGPSHNYDGAVQDQYNTAWAIEMLNQTVIQTGKPVAVAKVEPAFGLAGQTITLDGSGSYQQDPTKNIVSWTWLVNKVAGATGACTPGPTCDSLTGKVVTDTFACSTPPCNFQAQLTVTDNSSPAQTASTFATVQITSPPIPPTANAGGPYAFCNQVVPWTLDGSKSISPDAGQVETGCKSCTPNYLKSYAWSLDGSTYGLTSSTPQINATSALQTAHPAPGSYLVYLKVTDDSSQAFPPSPDLTSPPATATVVLQGNCGCITNLTPYARPSQVQVSWQNIGADSYNVYRSTNGTTFSKIGSVAGSGAPPTIYYIDSTVTNGVTYWYEVKPVSASHTPNEWCTSNVVTAKPTAR